MGDLEIAVSMVCVAGIESAGTGDLQEDARQVRGHALRFAECASGKKEFALKMCLTLCVFISWNRKAIHDW